MRTRLLVVMIAATMLIGLLGSLGGTVVNRAAEEEVLPPGASVVQAERVQMVHSRLRYRLAEGQTIHDLHRFLVQHGWRRGPQLEPNERVSNFVRQTPIAFGILEEETTMWHIVRETREVEVTIVRCVRSGGWIWCGVKML